MRIALLALAFISTSCEYATLKYGYYWNPIFVAEKAMKGLENNDLGAFSEVLSGTALCTYGTPQGMANLQATLKEVDTSSLKEPTLKFTRHLHSPGYIGFVTYYQEQYEAVVKDSNGKQALKVSILCQFGKKERANKYLNQNVSAYEKRSCSIVGIENKFYPLNSPTFCNAGI